MSPVDVQASVLRANTRRTMLKYQPRWNTVTLAQLAELVRALTNDLTAHGLIRGPLTRWERIVERLRSVRYWVLGW